MKRTQDHQKSPIQISIYLHDKQMKTEFKIVLNVVPFEFKYNMGGALFNFYCPLLQRYPQIYTNCDTYVQRCSLIASNSPPPRTSFIPVIPYFMLLHITTRVTWVIFTQVLLNLKISRLVSRLLNSNNVLPTFVSKVHFLPNVTKCIQP